jgi:hypothetical protein
MPVWGAERTQLVNRAKIVLHLHQYEWDTPWMRWCLAAANGAVVVSEPLLVPEPLRPGLDYAESTADGLAAMITDLARDEPRRAAMLENCRKTIEQHMTQTASLAKLAPRLFDLAKGRTAG